MLGSLIAGAVGTGVKYLFGKKAQKSSEKHAQNMFNQNAALQKEFAKSGIQWKVADARKAGINPIYALGAPTVSPAGVALGSDVSGVAHAGQDLSRAIHATRSASARTGAYERSVQELTLQKMGLENQLLGSQIAKINSSVGPPMPTDASLVEGQGDSGALNVQPMRRQTVRPGRPHIEAGAVAEVGHGRSISGWPVVYSEDVKQRLEEDPIGMIGWNIRNRLMPTFGHQMSPPHKAPSNAHWRWNPFKWEYQLYRNPKPSRVRGDWVYERRR